MIAQTNKPSSSSHHGSLSKVSGPKQFLLCDWSCTPAIDAAPNQWPVAMVESPSRDAHGEFPRESLGFTATVRVAAPFPASNPEPASELSERRGSSDALSLYMREVVEVALLTREEEVVLARRVQAGDSQAREHMIRANLRLVVKIAREYENLGLPLLDLINEGNIGLIKAVERFDPDKGARLSTYGSWWIKQRMRRALSDQGKTIRLPINTVDQIYHLAKAGVKLQEVFGREPTDAELADELGLSLRRVTELRGAALRPSSLDAPLGDEHSHNLAEVVADENAADPAQQAEDNDSLRRLRDLVARLPEREARIIRSRFGLDDGRERTLDTIGAKLGVTRERIRQLQNHALAKLRAMLEQPGRSAAAA